MMKVDSESSATSHTATRERPDGERFQRTLQEASARRGPPPPPESARAATTRPLLPRSAGLNTALAASRVVATSRGALSSPEHLATTRKAMHVESQRLGSVRVEGHASSQERTEQRITDLFLRELSLREPGLRPTPPRDAGPGMAASPPDTSPRTATPEGMTSEGRVMANGTSGPSRTEAPSHAESAVELIERIEVFVKSQRPAMSLSVRGTLNATVEVERTGPREVVLRIQGRTGPVPTEDVARLRDALEARGLRLRALHAG
ncbi:hypothetical protein MYSTI_03514 [Myxococcus stipitatus DSM 14675]|uniref:Uncharacterized protein n=1 Tax=Myxococcus stipitatus (strain DSM 14675 / JCM 12634 / Mx s8) TaxID=1278073 RepID=L7UAC8_MYXSD|nr:hypothetical protein [Myxococcus stipitatus]AGC44825.1 hypothetical protein MYSTI_03514 [Myxococcus stipitatus DSM 14675]